MIRQWVPAADDFPFQRQQLHLEQTHVGQVWPLANRKARMFMHKVLPGVASGARHSQLTPVKLGVTTLQVLPPCRESVLSAYWTRPIMHMKARLGPTSPRCDQRGRSKRNGGHIAFRFRTDPLLMRLK